MPGDEKVTVIVGADVSGLQSAFDKAKAWITSFVDEGSGKLSEGGKAIKEAFGGIKETLEGFSSGSGKEIIAGIGTALEHVIGPAGAVVGALLAVGAASVEFAAHTAEAAEHLVNLHFETGLSTESLKVWMAAAQQVGVSQDAIGAAVARMQMRLTELATTGEGSSKRLQGSLKILGLSMKDLAGDPTNALLEVGHKLQEAAEGGGNYSLIMGAAAQVMGRNFRELVPVVFQAGDAFNKLAAETKLYGTTVYQDVRADETAEDIHGLSRAWEELRNQIGALLMPVVDTLVKGLTDLLHGLDLLFKGINIGITTMKGFGLELEDWAKKLEPVAEGIDKLSRAWSGLKEATTWALTWASPFPAADTGLENTVNDARARGEALDKEEQAKTKQLAGGNAKIGGPGLTAAEIVQEIAERAKAEESKLAIVEAANKQMLAYGQETAAQEIAQEQGLANQKYQIQLRALQEESRVAGEKPAEHAKILAQIVDLESAHAVQMIGLATRLTQEQNKEVGKRIEEEIKGQNQILAVANALVDLHVKTLQTDAEEAAKIKAALATQELGIEKQELQDELNLQNLSLDQREKIADQIRDVNQKLTLQLIEDAKAQAEALNKTAQEWAKAWDEAIAPLGSTLDGFVNDFIDASKKAGESMHQVLADEFKKTIKDMLKSFVESSLMGLLTGGAKGSVTESIFGTKGGGANVEGGTAGKLGLGGGLAGLLSGILPGGPGGVFSRLLGTSPEATSGLAAAGTSLKEAAAVLKEAGERLHGTETTLPTSTAPSAPGTPDFNNWASTLINNTTITAGTGLPVVITGKEEGIETPAINPILPPAANPLSAIAASTPTSIPGSTPTSLSSASEALQAAAGQLKTSDDQLLSAAVQLQTSAAQLSAAAASKGAPSASSVTVPSAATAPAVTPASSTGTSGFASSVASATQSMSQLLGSMVGLPQGFLNIAKAVLNLPSELLSLGKTLSNLVGIGTSGIKSVGTAVFGGAQAATGQSVPLGDAGSQQASQALLTAAIQLQTAATALRTVATQLATTATHGAVSVPAAAPASGGGGGGGELAKITPLVSQSIGFLGSIGGNTGKMVAGIAQLVVSAAEQLIQLIALVIKPSFLGFTGASGGFTDKLGRGSTKVDDGKGGMLAVLHPHELILNQEQTSAFMTVPSAERGMIVPSAAAGMVVPGGGGGVPAILHPKEMVLPANISQGVQNMVAQGGAGGQGGTGGSGGDAESDSTGGDFNLTNHFHSSAIDGRGMNELFKQHAASISKIVMDHYNRKGGRYPAFGAG